jgi:UDPglucose--hexose-1-phosphate uridylyltransferase
VAEALARVRDAGHDLVTADRSGVEPVAADGPVAAWCPVASTSPYLVRVAHDAAGAGFDGADDPTVAAVAVAVRDALRSLRARLDDVPYNLVVHTAPRDDGPFHWYVEIVPRLSVVAGFELATGVLVNTVPPEHATVELREGPS